MARYSAGSRASSACARTLSSRVSSVGARLDRQRVGVGLRARRRNRRAPRASRRSARAIFASPGSSVDGLAEVLERRVGVALLPLDARPARDRGTALSGELAIAAGVGLRPPRRAGRRAPPRARAPSALLGAAELQHLDAARAGRSATDRRRAPPRTPPARRLRGSAPAAPAPRPTSADTSSCCALQLERAIEMRQRRLGVLARELDVAERRLRRIERRRRLQRRGELALGGLADRRPAGTPSRAMLVAAARAVGQRRRHRRPHEVGKLRRRRRPAPARSSARRR